MVSSFCENEILYEKAELTISNENLKKQLKDVSNLECLFINNDSKSIYLYEEPNKNSEIMGVLQSKGIGEITDMPVYENEIDKYLAEKPEWYYIKSGKYSGYIKNENLIVGKEAVTYLNDNFEKTLTINGNEVRVRKEPNTNCEILDELSNNTIVTINSNEYMKGIEWVPVIINNEYGYIKDTLVNIYDKVVFAEKYVKPKPAIKPQKVVPQKDEIPSPVVDYAKQFLGNPYVWGGESLTEGVDCSGFVMKVFEHFGVDLPHSSYLHRFEGEAVPFDKVQPGDIVCYEGHVGIYAGDGYIIDAHGSDVGIVMTKVNYTTVLTVRRVLK